MVFLPFIRPQLIRRKFVCLKAYQGEFLSKSVSRSSSAASFSTQEISHLRSPSKDDTTALHECMGNREGSIVMDENADGVLQAHNQDWTKHYTGQSKILLKPKTTDEISSILKYCNDERIGVVPQSGNTGLAGGSVPVRDEVILSLKNMNRIESLDMDAGVLRCEAGCILQDLQTYAADRQHLIPVDLGAKGTCLIGGNLSTNAGGQYYYRFGSLHANIVGLEVVLADGGRIINTMVPGVNLKDNTGYPLKHLFLGAEGTLGVITRLALLCPRLPSARQAAFVACPDYESVLRTLRLAKEFLGEILAAFELMDKDILDVLSDRGGKKIPVAADDGANYPFCVLIETQGSDENHDREKMERFLERAMTDDYVVDGALAQDLTQLADMWEIRESCNPTFGAQGYGYKYDISLPVADFGVFKQEVKDRLEGTSTVTGNWGHVMDGNLHVNVATPGIFEEDGELLSLLEPYIFDKVIERGGSISAEHGVGQLKRKYLPRIKDEASLSLMRFLKQTLDPSGILNPGKVLPPSLPNNPI